MKLALLLMRVWKARPRLLHHPRFLLEGGIWWRPPRRLCRVKESVSQACIGSSSSGPPPLLLHRLPPARSLHICIYWPLGGRAPVIQKQWRGCCHCHRKGKASLRAAGQRGCCGRGFAPVSNALSCLAVDELHAACMEPHQSVRLRDPDGVGEAEP